MVVVDKRKHIPTDTFGKLKDGDIFYYEDTETYYIRLTTNTSSPNAFCIETNMLAHFCNLDTPVTKINAEIILKD